MSKLYEGKIYLLSNSLWDTMNLKKIGVAIDPEDRIKTLSTSLPTEINILHQTTDLIDKFFYEHLVSKLLYKYRYVKNREFYQIELNDFNNIISSIETINKLYNSEESLLEFIENYDKEYYNKRFCKKETGYIQSKKNKYKKTTLSVDTSSVKI
jgi:hypothetical protein